MRGRCAIARCRAATRGNSVRVRAILAERHRAGLRSRRSRNRRNHPRLLKAPDAPGTKPRPSPPGRPWRVVLDAHAANWPVFAPNTKAREPARIRSTTANSGLAFARSVGRPSNEVRRSHASFTYQAGSWHKPRRVIAKVEWHPGELYPRVGFIVTNMTRPAENVVALYNKRGTC